MKMHIIIVTLNSRRRISRDEVLPLSEMVATTTRTAYQQAAKRVI